MSGWDFLWLMMGHSAIFLAFLINFAYSTKHHFLPMWWNGRRGRLKIYSRRLGAGSSPVIGTLPNVLSEMSKRSAFLFCKSFWNNPRRATASLNLSYFQENYQVLHCLHLFFFLINTKFNGSFQEKHQVSLLWKEVICYGKSHLSTKDLYELFRDFQSRLWVQPLEF